MTRAPRPVLLQFLRCMVRVLAAAPTSRVADLSRKMLVSYPAYKALKSSLPYTSISRVIFLQGLGCFP